MYLAVLMTRDEDFSSRLNNSATFHGFTALHYAVLIDDFEIVKLLLENGANPCLENDSGLKPVEYASVGEIKQLLEEYGQKVINKIV